MGDTRTEILRLGEALIRTKGYQGFSYRDIAAPLQVRNAAVHYHFSTKAELGVAVLVRARTALQAATEAWAALPFRAQLEHFMNTYEESKRRNWVCLMGALLPVYDTLPTALQHELTLLHRDMLDWLTDLLQRGHEASAFRFSLPARTQAHLTVASLLASLLLQKSATDEDPFATIKEGLIQSI
ncbi:3-oxoacyl-[acyl-carrier-protein] synthase II/TetR/AcrR family transcriptional regulator, transcriptional repressor for nem operon [Catalinimonas alkaloidigena]|uniref:3-oxoacyl-[acyl-carrier-protein] synthase II/TetR/AcrR family transcriptional regulator, transcriptional repressor for nem operon n=1 Tax=Catalinimonas alkaloidigena TaxID=1075417 RepID=A0A1G8Y4Z2_9BACT|nr:TetR/AcrR family transcriptional regulator [Catalinimonas alkaloidigena]SDJ97908.1 3-oxoacyl-[acyl-carrier-protein] synthase II/TetR/AcrR family transcriptional regulator, transcriptional repressor for nem operon [Catalinimonas alkaloidigena]